VVINRGPTRSSSVSHHLQHQQEETICFAQGHTAQQNVLTRAARSRARKAADCDDASFFFITGLLLFKSSIFFRTLWFSFSSTLRNDMRDKQRHHLRHT
jgi:hypothetical protein